MAYLKITLGISKYSSTGVIVHPSLHNPPEKVITEVLERDEHSCRYCGFKALKYQEVHFIGEGVPPRTDPRKKIKAENYATACPFCSQCFRLEKIARMQSGSLIWLPEIGQAALNHICRAIYIARVSRGPMAEAARDSMEVLLARKEEAENRLGTDSPKILSSIFKDFLEVREYKKRMGNLKGFRILPLDRRVITEGELEFNQFPQMLAYWRSKDGPFGAFQPNKWAESFFENQDKLKKA